jgi:hypothetical protein
MVVDVPDEYWNVPELLVRLMADNNGVTTAFDDPTVVDGDKQSPMALNQIRKQFQKSLLFAIPLFVGR